MKKITIFILSMVLHAGVIAQGVASDYLDINNIKARVNASGDLFWDIMNGQFEVPKNSGAGTIYADNLWIGGIDAGNQLKIAAQTYRQNGVDFWPGPLNSSAAADSTTGLTFNRVWKLNRCDIEAFHTWVTEGQPAGFSIDSLALNTIQTWPAVNPLSGAPLAPFFDYNQDGMYDANAGDYPLIKGDQAAFFVYNDRAAVHTSTNGNAIGLEIQTMVYEYNCPDSSLQNSIFVNYKIVNKSSFSLNNAFIGKWTNFDVGNANDDYVGCDVTRGAYYGYNGDSNDDGFYGQHPGAQGVVFLRGAYLDPNFIDDAASDSPNGIGYGDLIVDNEYLGMTRFMKYNNDNHPVCGNPVFAPDYYNYLSGRWKDGSPWTYGGNGMGPGTACDFQYPGDSDPSGFGIHGGMALSPWDESIAGNPASDRIALAATGPFQFAAGEIQEVEFAYVFGRDYNTFGAAAGVQVMKDRVDSIRLKYSTGIVSCGCSTTTLGVSNESLAAVKFNIYPNPANETLNIRYTSMANEPVLIELYNIQGMLLNKMVINSKGETNISIADLTPGLYLLKASDGNSTSVQRFVKQ
ncbi:MAG: hypothetical protein K0Q95_354 [Bacteroidota bacterium]|jgi:hypothetical protein|nr:hypothetical protein [Bacteroidota bacterium]